MKRKIQINNIKQKKDYLKKLLFNKKKKLEPMKTNLYVYNQIQINKRLFIKKEMMIEQLNYNKYKINKIMTKIFSI